MRELHVFAGIGGGIIGGMLLGHTTVCAVELEPYRRKVLLQRQRDGILPRFPIWDNAVTFDGRPWKGRVDVVCGGSPCTGISTARTNNPATGRPGIDGGGSELFFQLCRIAGETESPVCFWENSPAITTQGLDQVLRAFDEMGYHTRRGVFECRSDGADHIRARMFIIAYTDKAQFQGRRLSCGVSPEHANIGRFDWWENKPGLERVANGIPNQMDRLAAIGDAQIPRMVQVAWRTLTQGLE